MLKVIRNSMLLVALCAPVLARAAAVGEVAEQGFEALVKVLSKNKNIDNQLVEPLAQSLANAWKALRTSGKSAKQILQEDDALRALFGADAAKLTQKQLIDAGNGSADLVTARTMGQIAYACGECMPKAARAAGLKLIVKATPESMAASLAKGPKNRDELVKNLIQRGKKHGFDNNVLDVNRLRALNRVQPHVATELYVYLDILEGARGKARQDLAQELRKLMSGPGGKIDVDLSQNRAFAIVLEDGLSDDEFRAMTTALKEINGANQNSEALTKHRAFEAWAKKRLDDANMPEDQARAHRQALCNCYRLFCG